jgi:hypothetical protein
MIENVKFCFKEFNPVGRTLWTQIFYLFNLKVKFIVIKLFD